MEWFWIIVVFAGQAAHTLEFLGLGAPRGLSVPPPLGAKLARCFLSPTDCPHHPHLGMTDDRQPRPPRNFQVGNEVNVLLFLSCDPTTPTRRAPSPHAAAW